MAQPDTPLKADDYSGIAARFRQLRLRAEMTEAEFAYMLGRPPGSVALIEEGRLAPSIADLRILRAEFNVSFDYLMEGEGTMEEDSDYLQKQLEECRAENAALVEIINNSL